MKRLVQPLFKNPPPSATHHSREDIIAEARKECPDIGDGAMIAEMEWGYWVGASVYVDKEKLNNMLSVPGERGEPK